MAAFDQKTLKRLWEGNGGSAEGPATQGFSWACSSQAWRRGGRLRRADPLLLACGAEDFRGNVTEDVGLDP